jgi:hypothetical protein
MVRWIAVDERYLVDAFIAVLSRRKLVLWNAPTLVRRNLPDSALLTRGKIKYPPWIAVAPSRLMTQR